MQMNRHVCHMIAPRLRAHASSLFSWSRGQTDFQKIKIALSGVWYAETLRPLSCWIRRGAFPSSHARFGLSVASANNGRPPFAQFILLRQLELLCTYSFIFTKVVTSSLSKGFNSFTHVTWNKPADLVTPLTPKCHKNFAQQLHMWEA